MHDKFFAQILKSLSHGTVYRFWYMGCEIRMNGISTNIKCLHQIILRENPNTCSLFIQYFTAILYFAMYHRRKIVLWECLQIYSNSLQAIRVGAQGSIVSSIYPSLAKKIFTYVKQFAVFLKELVDKDIIVIVSSKLLFIKCNVLWSLFILQITARLE